MTIYGVIQKVMFLGNTDNVNFGWFAYHSTDGHPKKCYPILNHAPNLESCLRLVSALLSEQDEE